jgi:hypothetical protein
MDEEERTCGRCKGKALLDGVVEHATDVEYTALHIPLGTARVEGGARITYVCACGNRFSFISRLRRARFFGGALFGAVFGSFWWYLATGMGRHDAMASPWILMVLVFALVSVVSLLAILADAFSRLRNPRWAGD